MINSFINEIRKQLQSELKYVSEYLVNECLISLLVLKYYCDNSVYSYENLVNNKIEEEIYFPIDDLKVKIGNTRYTRLLPFIQYSKLEDLIKEYLNDRSFDIDFINREEKKVCIPTQLVKELYDLSGNTSYVIDKLRVTNYDTAVFKFFDKVLGVNNKYLKFEDIAKEKLNYIYLYDNIPKYRFIRNSDNDIYVIIRRILATTSASKVILHTDYKKVANLKELRFLLDSLEKVILYDDKNTFLFFTKNDSKEVSIINYNKDKIKSLDQLYKVIDNNRKQIDVLVKVSTEDIKNNFFRIGFKLYQNKTGEEVKNINEIVDENTRLIERLSRINKDIEEEINNLINK